MMYYDFNKTLQALYPDYYARQNTAEYFVDDIANLNLSRLVVLCGDETYSAAEATIWDLKPFMDVVTIGSTTGGKNTMMYVLSPSDFTYSQTGKPYYSTTINNWLIFPIVAVYMNANYEAFDTTDGDGMDPDFEVNELSGLMTSGLYDLGDPKERLLMSALEYLNTGVRHDQQGLGSRRATDGNHLLGREAKTLVQETQGQSVKNSPQKEGVEKEIGAAADFLRFSRSLCHN